MKQKRHEAEHSKRGDLVIIKQTRHVADHSKVSFGNYKAEGA